MNQTSPQTDENLAVPAHRSPHSFEVVEPVSSAKQRRLDAYETNKEDAQPYLNSPLALHNDRVVSDVTIVHEKPEHRIILLLKAQGLANYEIAEKTGYSRGHVNDICKQPWFRLRLVQELQAAGQDAIQETIKGAALDSVHVLIDLRDSAQAPFAVRKSAADSLLDRFLGKAIQKVETKDVSLPSTPEIRKVEEEIASIDKQLQTPEPPTNTVAEPQPPNEKPQT